MPRRDTILLAIVGVAALLGCLAIAQIATDPRPYNYDGEHTKHASSGQNLAAQRDGGMRNRRPPGDQSICRYTESEKEYELCQAWRAADGAQDAAATAWWQLIVSIGALVGLAYTVRYTKQAAHGAREAATAAQASGVTASDTLQAMRETAQRQLRAYVGVSGVEFFVFDVGKAIWARIAVVNAGQTPAHDVCIWARVDVRDVRLLEPLPQLSTDPVTKDALIGPGIALPVEVCTEELLAPELLQAEVGETIHTQLAVFVHGRIRYVDAFESPQETEFRYYTGGGHGFRDWVLRPHSGGNQDHYGPDKRKDT